MSNLSSQLKTLWWYVRNPSFLPQAAQIIKRKILNPNKENSKNQSINNCRLLAISTNDAIYQLFGEKNIELFEDLYPNLYSFGIRKQKECPHEMGGAGNLTLLYQICELIEGRHAIETGVAYGWSSLALLQSLHKRNGKLISTDLPYAKMDNEDYVGTVLPEQLKTNWNLIRLPDRTGLPKALNLLDNSIDLCHYDSDKSYDGRMFAYPLLWDALREGGIFISDDIGDNLGFFDFAEQVKSAPLVVEWDSKYIGILKK